MISESSLCELYNIPVVSPCGNKVEGDDFNFNFDFDKNGLGFDDLDMFPDYIQSNLDNAVADNFFPGLVHDKTDTTPSTGNIEIFNDILTGNDFNFNFLLSADDNLPIMKKEPNIDTNYEKLGMPEPLESLPDEGWFSNSSYEHPSSSSMESLKMNSLESIKAEAAVNDDGELDCLLNPDPIFPDTDVDLAPPSNDQPRILSTWKVKSSWRRPLGSSLRQSQMSSISGNSNVQGRPFGSNTAPCYNDYSASRSSFHLKNRSNRRHNAHRQFKPRNRDYSMYGSESCTPVTTPVHRHGQTERERRAQENKRMRNIETAIRSISAFKSDAYFPRDRATKERTLKATKALIHFYHNSNIEMQNANLRAEIDEMKYRLSTARRLKQQHSTPFSGVNSNSTMAASSVTPTISRLSTNSLNISSNNKFIHRHSTLTSKAAY